MIVKFTGFVVGLLIAASSGYLPSYGYENPSRDQALELMKQKDYDQALKRLAEAIGMNPTDPDLYYLRGKCFLYLNNKDLAIADLNRTLDLSPQMWRAFLLRGIAYSLINRDQAASKDFEDAIRLNARLASKYFEDKSQTHMLPAVFGEVASNRDAIKTYKFTMDKLYPLGYLPEGNDIALEGKTSTNRTTSDGDWLSESNIK